MEQAAVDFPVRIRVAADADITDADAQASVASSVDTRMRAFGIPARAAVTVERGGPGLELTLGSRPSRTAGPDLLAAMPADTIIDVMMHASMIEFVTAPSVARLWTMAGFPAVEEVPRWFMLLVEATIWAGGYVGDLGILAAVARPALEGRERDRDPDVLAEQILRHQPRLLEFAAADETLPRLAELLRAAPDGTSSSQRLYQLLGALASCTPATVLCPDAGVPVGQVAIRLGRLTLGDLPVPAAGTMIACIAPRHLAGLDGVLGTVQVAGQPDAAEGWSLLQADSPAAAYMRTSDPALTDHLATGAAALLAQRAHLLPSLDDVASVLATLVESSAYSYSVWFARQYLSDLQVTAILRLVLSNGVPIEELPLILRDLFVALHSPGSELAASQPAVAQLAKVAQDQYARRSAGEPWDAAAETVAVSAG